MARSGRSPIRPGASTSKEPDEKLVPAPAYLHSIHKAPSHCSATRLNCASIRSHDRSSLRLVRRGAGRLPLRHPQPGWVPFFLLSRVVADTGGCAASGLLYLAEIIEERSQSAKRIGKQAIYVRFSCLEQMPTLLTGREQCIIGAHILFMVFDGLPFQQTAFGIACHVVYLFNFSKSWPFISLTSPAFMASCGLVVADHFAWFWYFSERAHDPKHGFGRHNQPYRPAWDDGRHRGGFGDDLTFMDVATFVSRSSLPVRPRD